MPLCDYCPNMSSLNRTSPSKSGIRGFWTVPVVALALCQAVLAGPRLTFHSTVHEFGDIWDVETLPCAFTFLNTGDQPLIIEKVHPGCGCTTTTLEKMVFAPGESGTIDAAFKPNATGSLAKTITVLSNDSDAPTKTLYLRANVTPFVKVDPRVARLPSLVLGDGGHTDVLLTPAEPTFTFSQEIRTRGPSSKHIKAQLLPAPDGAPSHARVLRVAALPTAPWGDLQCFVTVSGQAAPGADKPDIPQKPHDVKVTALGAVHGQLTSDVTTFSFGGVKPGQSFTDRIRITSLTGTPFTILDQRVSMRPKDVTLDVQPITETGVIGYDLTLSGNANDYMGTLAGKVLIRTDVPGESTLTFRTVGLVRYPKPGK